MLRSYNQLLDNPYIIVYYISGKQKGWGIRTLTIINIYFITHYYDDG